MDTLCRLRQVRLRPVYGWPMTSTAPPLLLFMHNDRAGYFGRVIISTKHEAAHVSTAGGAFRAYFPALRMPGGSRWNSFSLELLIASLL